jgi:hypothetical protein
MEQLGSHWKDFHKILYLNIFRKSVEKIKFFLKSGNITCTLPGDLCTFMMISRWILLRMKNDSDKSCRENQNTHFVFRIENRAVYEIMWTKYGRVAQGTVDNIIWRMRFARWITKATDTHSEYVIIIVSPRQQWLVDCSSILCYTYISCLVVYNSDCTN